MLPPKPLKIKKVLKYHGDSREDPYYWMNQRDHKRVLSLIRKEKKYFDSIMDPTQKLQNKIFREIKNRILEKDVSPPYPSGDYVYFTKYEKKKDYPTHCRRKKNHKKIQTILDVNEIAKKHKYCDVGGLSLSFSHNIMAFAVDTVGRRFYTIYFKNLKSGRLLPHKIKNTSSDILWANDDENLFYVRQDSQTLRSYQVFRYNLKTKKQTCVYEEKDKTFSVDIYKTLSKKFIFIQSLSTMTTECRFIEAHRPLSSWKVFQRRKRGHKYYILDGEDCFYILTNSKKCQNYRLDQASLRSYKMNHWRKVIPHDPSIYIEDFEVFKNFIALEIRKRGGTQIILFNRKTRRIHRIPTQDDCYVIELGTNAQYDTDQICFSYESMNRPGGIYNYNLKTKKIRTVKKKKLNYLFRPHLYSCERKLIPSRDGKKIPVSLLYRKSMRKKGQNPMLLYAYGSYGFSTEPSFHPHIFSLVDRGFIFAIAHVRGGSEMGQPWYEDGKLLKKRNTFYDFIDCSKYLIQKKYSHPQKLYAMGGSAGGLLMGGVLNFKPDLYKAMIIHVPFVDALTTMLDDSIPLTTGEYDEWGNPHQKKFYNYMKSYSPYDNVQPKNYPHLLVTSGYHDSQVQYWEPLKWVSKLRENQKASSNILLYMDMDTGHGGSTGKFKRLRFLAMEYAYLLNLENI